MSAGLALGGAGAAPLARRGFSPRVERGALWLLGYGGGFAFIEPSPWEIAFFLVLFVLGVGGLRLHRSTLPMVALLALFNIGGVFSLAPFLHDGDSVMFIAVSIYLMATSVLFAAMMLDRGAERFAALRSGLTWGAATASTAGILGYFDVAGLGAIFTVNDRASGTFKDPNVLGTFVIFPLVLLAQDMLTGRGRFWRDAALFSLILVGGVFLSFSRGAWGHAGASLLVVTGLTFLFAATPRIRMRILGLVALAPVVGVGALGAALSIEPVREMFEVRASLNQYYDVGPTGRFGNHARALPTLFAMPNGYGPRQFRYHWPEDPHNVYINAFASYGWLGGVAYLALTLATIAVGFATVAMRSSLQPLAIAVWSTLFVQMLQGFLIDTDHWRHYYLLLGLIWGLFALARIEAAARARVPAGGPYGGHPS
ncbi:O-antigen ligase family protein [Salinarimonas rosea]|uniref:O-antigen ligase family protein n=1 Tax=Salinarimonas rosea TaxID=552063 RepID=UPI00040A73ED|nr:O-antigen ligase family protein [Salinarimonas rosea]